MTIKIILAAVAVIAMVLGALLWSGVDDPGLKLAIVLFAWGCAYIPLLAAAKWVLNDIANSGENDDDN